ncbi:MAG TPA: hypothetical protein VKD22_06945 [Ramlibacter sp.]|nr:hypothetical protein [Ramlibacter sp.]
MTPGDVRSSRVVHRLVKTFSFYELAGALTLVCGTWSGSCTLDDFLRCARAVAQHTPARLQLVLCDGTEIGTRERYLLREAPDSVVSVEVETHGRPSFRCVYTDELPFKKRRMEVC